MKRYYLSPWSLVENPDGLGLVPVLKATTYPGLNCATKLQYGPDNVPLSSFGLVLAAGLDHSGPANDAALGPFPDISLDSTLGVLNNRVRSTFLQKLAAFGVDTTGYGTQTTLREIVDDIGQFLSGPAFTANRFDAQEPA